MSHLSVANFGPIKYFAGDLARVNVLIGPQASGKSTIAKLLYYLKMLPVKLATFTPSEKAGKNYYEQYMKILKLDFANLFGPVYHQPGLAITYSFTKSYINYEYKVHIANNSSPSGKNYLSIKFDKRLKEGLELLLQNIADLRNRETRGVVSSRISRLHQEGAQKDFFTEAGELFGEKRSPIFIPAGRTLLTLLSGQLTSFKSTDMIMDDFLDTIRDIRPQVGKGLVEIEDQARHTWPRQPDPNLAQLARGEIQKILRGHYVFAEGEERIYHSSSGSYTKLSVASSGQQEALWVILLAYMLILERAASFAVFEEPEAHLYPESQYAIIRLLALLASANADNQLLITTHSPYVLVSLNNLLTAKRVGNKHSHKVSEMLPKPYWLDIDDLAAFVFTGEGSASGIVDRETGLVKAEEIDSASAIMNEEYDRMMDLDFGGAGQ